MVRVAVLMPEADKGLCPRVRGPATGLKTKLASGKFGAVDVLYVQRGDGGKILRVCADRESKRQAYKCED
jgi:hypothetical protein